MSLAITDLFESSGPSPTHLAQRPALHLIGPGAVGRALLPLLAARHGNVVAATDRSGTVHDPFGLDPDDLLTAKAAGDLAAVGAIAVPLAEAVLRGAKFLVCLLPTDEARASEDLAWTEAALDDGRAVVFAAKHVLAAAPHLGRHPRVGFDAVLGGTGARLQADLPRFRGGWSVAECAGNASTTTIIEAVERGASFADGLEAARLAGVLEPDPELDLRGVDAATKLRIVAGLLLDRPVTPDEIATPDLRDVDPERIRDRARRGATTRLVGRVTPDGAITLDFEEVERHAPLAAPPDRVAYRYVVGGRERLHVGDGIGPVGTARAVLRDLVRLGACGGAR